MEQGPLPPHERTWRHPSELAAEERETARAQAAAPSTRVFALTTGTIGLIAVGILVLTVTPHRQESPIATSATTSPAASGLPGAGSEVPDTARPAALAARGPATTRPVASAEPALATPIGDGRMALITDDAMVGHNVDRVAVRLPSGRSGSGRLVERSGDAWLIELVQAESGHKIARQRPQGSEIVTVMATPPVTIALADIATIEIEEGTAVLDGSGDLIGICGHRHSDGSVRLIEVTAEVDDATNDDR